MAICLWLIWFCQTLCTSMVNDKRTLNSVLHQQWYYEYHQHHHIGHLPWLVWGWLAGCACVVLCCCAQWQWHGAELFLGQQSAAAALGSHVPFLHLELRVTLLQQTVLWGKKETPHLKCDMQEYVSCVADAAILWQSKGNLHFSAMAAFFSKSFKKIHICECDLTLFTFSILGESLLGIHLRLLLHLITLLFAAYTYSFLLIHTLPNS